MSSNVHTAKSKNDGHLDLVHHLPPKSRQGDPSIDDPVNDTGVGPRCGDLQIQQSSHQAQSSSGADRSFRSNNEQQLSFQSPHISNCYICDALRTQYTFQLSEID